MNALWRTFFVSLGLLTILVLSAYYVISLPKFQKKLIEDRLPKGSSIHAVQITKESIELTDLSLSLPNGTVVQIGSLHSRFSIWSALFERTIFLRKIKLDELNIKLPDSEPSLQPYFNSQESRSKNLSSIYFTLSRVLRFVEKGDWRFDVDPTQVSGVLTDATGNSHIFNLTATEVALGTETIVRANLDFGSKKTIQDGLKNYELIINLVFAQMKEGGFHQIRLESLIECTSASDDILLSFAHDLNLSLKSRGEIININFEPLKFWKQVAEIRPTILTLAIRTMHTMLKQGSPNLTYMKNLSTGSAPVTKHQMNMMRSTGAQNVWNIYGSTECIPPVLMTQTDQFDFKDTPYYLEYNDSLIVDGFDTDDVFENNLCLGRSNLNNTWKS